uniref:Uncharacterized protein n=1 Tax=Phenylobacterium glaciei TaxID=2803784 RepID=A0A974S9L7_9CAUL|nr:hypothetical protein JKL49_11625 [Phenylobacterium glaciei]
MILDVSFKMLPSRPASSARRRSSPAISTRPWPPSNRPAVGPMWWPGSTPWRRGEPRPLAHLSGEHARRDEVGDARSAPPRPARAIPVDFPNFTLNRLTVSAFNAAYFQAGLWKQGEQIVPVHPYFFPLDGIGDWNRVYGARGFVQHQCVIPKAHGRQALGEILELVSARGSRPSSRC